MPRREANFQTEFNEWCRTNRRPTAAYELKQTEMGILPFDVVKEHQINALLAANQGIICYKIPDDTRSYKPFDSFCLNNVPAYVVIKFSRNFYGIDIKKFLIEKNLGDRQSLTEARCKEIAAFCGIPSSK